ncbi:MAG: hypothetical protein KC964_27700, partial [Candidatus Omnitrophica bacterium]|nr:hypothetical protein [Candidatus Omnitrophota bacterium]
MFQAQPFSSTLMTLILFLVAGPAFAVLQGDFELNKGFEIEEVGSQDLAPDIYTLTFSPRGEPVVSGKGYVR